MEARVQKRCEFVEIGRGMGFNYHSTAVRLVTGWYHLAPRTIYESTVYMYENVEYVRVLEVHLYNMYEYMNACVPAVAC